MERVKRSEVRDLGKRKLEIIQVKKGAGALSEFVEGILQLRKFNNKLYIATRVENKLWYFEGMTFAEILTGKEQKPYGSMYRLDNTTVTSVFVAGTDYQITVFNTDGPASGLKPDNTQDHIEVLRGGKFYISMAASFDSAAGAAVIMRFRIKKNNGASIVGGMQSEVEIDAGGAQDKSVAISGIASLDTGDTVEVWVANETNTQNPTINNIHLSMHRLS